MGPRNLFTNHEPLIPTLLMITFNSLMERMFCNQLRMIENKNKNKNRLIQAMIMITFHLKLKWQVSTMTDKIIKKKGSNQSEKYLKTYYPTNA